MADRTVDWKHVYNLASKGALLGCDYSGIVEEVGDEVDGNWKKGDRICGAGHGGNAVQHEDGAFAEHIVVKGGIQMHIPESLSFEEAATLGIGISTVGLERATPCGNAEIPQGWPRAIPVACTSITKRTCERTLPRSHIWVCMTSVFRGLSI